MADVVCPDAAVLAHAVILLSLKQAEQEHHGGGFKQVQLTYALSQKMEHKLQLGLPRLLINLVTTFGRHELGQQADFILRGSRYIQRTMLLQSIHHAFPDEGDKVQAGALHLHA